MSKKFEATQAESHKRFGNAYENLAVIAINQREAAEERLEQLLVEGLNSGPSIEITPKHIEKKRQRLIERHANKTKKP